MHHDEDVIIKVLNTEHKEEVIEILKESLEELGVEIDIDKINFEKFEIDYIPEIPAQSTSARLDYVLEFEEIVFLIEHQSRNMRKKDDIRFNFYNAIYNHKMNDKNKEVIFIVFSTSEKKSYIRKYKPNILSSFKMIVFSFKELDSEEIIKNITYLMDNKKEIPRKEILKLAISPLVDYKKGEESKIEETFDLINQIPLDESYKITIYGLGALIAKMIIEKKDLNNDVVNMYMERVDYLTKFTNEGMQLALKHPEKVKDEKGFRRQVAEDAINMIEQGTRKLRKEKDEEIAQIKKEKNQEIAQIQKEKNQEIAQIQKEKDKEIALQREKIQNSVLHLLNDGKTPEEISEIIDLSIEEINELINTN